MKKILMLSGPNKKEGYNDKVNQILFENLKDRNNNLLCITANPEKYEKNDSQVNGDADSLGIVKMLEKSGIKINEFLLLDNRNINEFNKKDFQKYNIIYLMGGDPILQMNFIKDNGLDSYIKETNSFVIGVSAGSMNMSKKTFLPQYELNKVPRLVDGLDLCDITITPHFDIDNEKQCEEIEKISKENKIVALPNDSGIFINNKEIIYINKYYEYKDGKLI